MLSLEEKQLTHEAVQSFPSSAEVKNDRSYTFIPSYTFMQWKVRKMNTTDNKTTADKAAIPNILNSADHLCDAFWLCASSFGFQCFIHNSAN
jgi:hypothetical protein